MTHDNESNVIAGDGNERVAVLVPCFNEGSAIGTVVRDFRRVLPHARVYVYDNNSTDDTVQQAKEAGAIVNKEFLQGKGNVVRRMFADVEADMYLLIDGDNTYDADDAPLMIDKLKTEQLDMVNGMRVSNHANAYRRGHRFGNKMLTSIVALFFGNTFKDLLSGYRIFSRRFVKTFPAHSAGFEIETELTIHALEMRMKVAEMKTKLQERAEGTESKLHTYRDGLRILRTILMLIKEERPLAFFATFGVILALISFGFALPVILEYMETGLIARLPTLLLSTGLMLLGFLSLANGLILDTVTRGRRELKRLQYLSYSAPGHGVK